jgi:glycosyltransferase involved in cell wall biosynthesis
MTDNSAVPSPDTTAYDRQRPIVFLVSRRTTGGATLNAVMLAEQAIIRGKRAELWCLYHFAELDTGAVPTRVFFNYEPHGLVQLLFMVGKFVRAVLNHKPRAVVGFHPLANVIGALGSVLGYRFIGTQRNPSDSQRGSLRRIEAVLGGTPLYRANVAVSEAVRDSYLSYSDRYVRKLRVIHNGLPPLTSINSDQTEARASLGLPTNGILVGNVGRLHPQKAPDFLLDVARCRIPGVTFVLAGEGPLEAELRAATEVEGLPVVFTGRLAGADVTRLLRSLDVFLFPSRFEGFGRALIEAMSEGLPVIAHDMPVTREVAGDLGIFLPYDAQRWATQIARITTYPIDLIMRDRLVERGQSFSLDAMTSAYLDLTNEEHT